MRLRVLIPALAAVALATLRPASAEQFYAIGDGGASLLRFSSDSPGSVSSVSFTGAAAFLDGLDFRPSTGQLYGYLDATDSLYTVDLNTGALAFASTLSAGTNTFRLGVDFNPTVDRLRVVTDSQQNLRVNVDNGATTVDGPLTYAMGDPNAGSPATRIIEAAYTNNLANATSTQLYYIDYNLDILATTTAPNDGILNTVGSLGVDTSDLVGFDIFTTASGVNTAYALLNVNNSPGLFSINLSTGAATSLGALAPGFGNVYGLAVVPTAIPEPASLAMLGVGLLGAAGFARRRRHRKSA